MRLSLIHISLEESFLSAVADLTATVAFVAVFVTLKSPALRSFVSVSYTHLDVYKRQLGHSSIHITEIYTHVAMSKQRAILTTRHPRNTFHL